MELKLELAGAELGKIAEKADVLVLPLTSAPLIIILRKIISFDVTIVASPSILTKQIIVSTLPDKFSQKGVLALLGL